MSEYVYQEYPRDLIHRESKSRREWKAKKDVPTGWWTVDTDEEINPSPVQSGRATGVRVERITVEK